MWSGRLTRLDNLHQYELTIHVRGNTTRIKVGGCRRVTSAADTDVSVVLGCCQWWRARLRLSSRYSETCDGVTFPLPCYGLAPDNICTLYPTQLQNELSIQKPRSYKMIIMEPPDRTEPEPYIRAEGAPRAPGLKYTGRNPWLHLRPR